MSKLKKKRNQNVLIYFLLLHSIAEITTYLALAIVTRQLSYLCRETVISTERNALISSYGYSQTCEYI